ncbi:hypothetical protein GCM10027516_10810 [Niabella aquatica]
MPHKEKLYCSRRKKHFGIREGNPRLTDRDRANTKKTIKVRPDEVVKSKLNFSFKFLTDRETKEGMLLFPVIGGK